MKFISTAFYTVFVVILLAVAGTFLASMLPIPGNIELKIVKSGSMEPAILTGSLVVVKPETTYAVGNVITFGEDTKTKVPTTHRVVHVRDAQGQVFFTTKGDANEEADPQEVAFSDVIGKVVLAVPYAGFVLDFARQPMGFAALIGIPAALIIFEELFAIYREVRRIVRRRKGDDEPGASDSGGESRRVYLRQRAMDEIFVPMTMMIDLGRVRVAEHKDRYVIASIISISLFVSTFGISETTATLSYFADLEGSIGNIFRAGEWQAADPEADPQSIVINEFLPNPDGEAYGFDFGNDASTMPQGEWVELYNTGSVPVNLVNWYLSDDSGGLGNQAAIISAANTQPATTIIPAGGWLVVYFNKPVLNDTGDSIYLYTSGSVLVDSYTYDDPSDGCFKEPSPGETNPPDAPTGTPGNGKSGDCNQALVAPNKSYARIPDGTGAFVDPIPTPGSFNIPDPAPASSNEPAEAPIEPSDAGEVQGVSAEDPMPETESAEPVLESTEEPSESAEPHEPVSDASPEESVSEPEGALEPELVPVESDTPVAEHEDASPELPAESTPPVSADVGTAE